jgi:hypothetical protein
VPAAKVEAVVLDAVRRHIGHDAPIDNTELLTTYVRQIEVRRTEIAISLRSEDQASEDEKDNLPAGLDLGQPLPSARDSGNELDPGCRSGSQEPVFATGFREQRRRDGVDEASCSTAR